MSRIDDFMSKHGMDAVIVFSEKTINVYKTTKFSRELKKALDEQEYRLVHRVFLSSMTTLYYLQENDMPLSTYMDMICSMLNVSPNEIREALNALENSYDNEE